MHQKAFYILWTLLCLHTTVSFAPVHAASGDALAQVDALISQASESGIVLDAAPSILYQQAITPIFQTNFTPWEIVHRTPMLQGFTWSGEVANFVTPAMYIGTPIQTSSGIIGYDPNTGPTNYTECVRAEMVSSFGSGGKMLESTPKDEFRNIAKYCATEFLSHEYFSWKNYTTREEMLLFLFTLGEEDIGLAGYFDGKKFVSDGRETKTPFTNISPKAWYAPYLALANEYGMIDRGTTWEVAKEVSDRDIQKMLQMYSTDSPTNIPTNTSGQFDISTQFATYTFSFDAGNITNIILSRKTVSSPASTQTGTTSPTTILATGSTLSGQTLSGVVQDYLRESRDTSRIANLTMIAAALAVYRIDSGSLPDTPSSECLQDIKNYNTIMANVKLSTGVLLPIRNCQSGILYKKLHSNIVLATRLETQSSANFDGTYWPTLTMLSPNMTFVKGSVASADANNWYSLMAY